jgi:hypothetical protein
LKPGLISGEKGSGRQGLRPEATDGLIPVAFGKTVMQYQFVLEVHAGIKILLFFKV